MDDNLILINVMTLLEQNPIKCNKIITIIFNSLLFISHTYQQDVCERFWQL